MQPYDTQGIRRHTGEIAQLVNDIKDKFDDLSGEFPSFKVLGAALVHIFRYQGDQIVELWDLAQPITENSPNEKGVF